MKFVLKKMKSTQLIICFAVFSSCTGTIYDFHSTHYEKIKDKYQPLLITQEKNNWDLAKPIGYRNGIYEFSTNDSFDAIHYACPAENDKELWMDYIFSTSLALHLKYTVKRKQLFPKFAFCEDEISFGMKTAYSTKSLDNIQIGFYIFKSNTIPTSILQAVQKEQNETSTQDKEPELIYVPLKKLSALQALAMNSKPYFIKLYDLLFNSYTKTPKSVSYKLLLPKMLPIENLSLKYTPFVSNSEYFNSQKIDTLYALNRRKIHIYKNIYGDNFATYFNKPLNILKPQQLAPTEDFLLTTWQTATLSALNTAPIWNAFKLKWKLVEKFVRKVAKEIEHLEIQTGVFGILKLKINTEKLQDVEIFDFKEEIIVKVPKIFYKVVKQVFTIQKKKYKNGIVIIMHNNPHIKEEKICEKNICIKNGWLISNEDHRTGLIYCCPLTNETMKKLDETLTSNFNILNLNQVSLEVKGAKKNDVNVIDRILQNE